MTIDRRRALALMALGAAGPTAALAKPHPTAGQAAAFLHGVASGDPWADSVLLWTRATPTDPKARSLTVEWELAADPAFVHILARGQVATGPERDFTVKAVAGGLKPGRDYHYRFRCGATASPTGRPRTLPAGPTPDAVLAFVTCSLYPGGHFNAYDHIARLERVDAVVHLGDYIYEYGAANDDYGMEHGRRLGRIPEPPHEIVTLADYRTRHALYKRDPDLQAAHARAPWIVVWDDHEVANDTWVGGAENHQPKAEGPWLDREAAALKAYYEWMPIREPEPGRAFEAINRAFQFGDLASLIMVESRLVARSWQLEYDRPGDVPLAVYDSADPAVRKRVTDPQVVGAALAAARAGQAPPAPYVIGPDVEALNAIIADPERQMLGARQEQWLAREISGSVAAGRPWQVLGNQVVMARTRAPDIRRAIGPERLAALLAAMPEAGRAQAARTIGLFTFDVPFDLDGWDGYPAARERMFDAIKSAQGNAIVVSGDSHAFWANELHDAAGQYVAAEFGTSAVTSPSPGDDLPGVDLGRIFTDTCPEVKFCDQKAKGYVRLTLTRTEARAEMITVDVMAKPYASGVAAAFLLRPAAGPAPSRVEKV